MQQRPPRGGAARGRLSRRARTDRDARWSPSPVLRESSVAPRPVAGRRLWAPRSGWAPDALPAPLSEHLGKRNTRPKPLHPHVRLHTAAPDVIRVPTAESAVTPVVAERELNPLLLQAGAGLLVEGIGPTD